MARRNGGGLELIDSVLWRWGGYEARAISRSLGYGATSPIFRLMPRAARSIWTFGAMEITATDDDVAVCAEVLAGLPPVLARTAREYYVNGGGTVAVAFRMGVHRKTVRERLSKVREAVGVEFGVLIA